MPPKPPSPPEDFESRHTNAVRLETRVRGLLERGRKDPEERHDLLKQAQRVFDQEWERTILPHLPIQKVFELARLDKRGVAKLVERADESVVLELRQGVDPRNAESTGVMISDQEEVLGFLPEEVEEILQRAGEHADLYEVKALTITGLGTSKPSLLMNLVRPNLRQCSAKDCGKLHTGEHENCDDCRKKRRRKTKSLEETAEQPPVPLANAFQAISHESTKQ